MADAASARPVKIFVSYAHEDGGYRDELKVTLAWMEHQKLVQSWTDKKIVPSEEWEPEIRQALEEADIVVLLISRYFLASPFILDKELAPTIAAHDAGTKRVVPIWVSDVDDTGAPYLKIQGPIPKDQPIEDWEKPSKAWKQISTGIRAILAKYFTGIEDVGTPSDTSPTSSAPQAIPLSLQSSLPLPPRNREFTGREVDLKAVETALTGHETAAILPVTTIHGDAGIGKTQLAIEYAYQHAADYRYIWYIIAQATREDDETRSRGASASQDDKDARGFSLADEIGRIAEDLELPEAQPTVPADAKLAAVHRALGQRRNWLIIFDNVVRPEHIDTYRVPRTPGGHQLITSRCTEWDDTITPVQLDVFAEDDARAYIHRRLAQNPVSDDDANTLAKTLGYHALALAQATAYIKRKRVRVDTYLRYYEEKAEVVLGKDWRTNAEQDRNPQDAVDHTWRLSVEAAGEALADEDEAPELVADFLHLTAFFAPDNIPLETLRAQAEHLPDRLREVAEDEIRFDTLLGALQAYSLGQRTQTTSKEGKAEDNFTVHRLVPRVTFDGMTDDEQQEWGKVALEVLDAALDVNMQEYTNWPIGARHAEHAEACVKTTEAVGLRQLEQARLLNQIARYKQDSLDYKGAKSTYMDALTAAERLEGEETYVAGVLNNLGDLLRTMGDLPGAKSHHERALKIREDKLGDDHPDVAQSLNNLAAGLQAMGDLPGAKKRYERAIEIDERVYGPDHPNVATDVNNLALVLQDMGDLPGAKERFERALEIGEATQGKDHPKIAIRLNNLAGVLWAMGDLPGAKERYERALKILEKVLGDDHPNVASALNNLAGVLKAMDDLPGAKERYERALEIGETTLGKDHPSVGIRCVNLGVLLAQTDQRDEGRDLIERAWDIFTAKLGPEHPNTKNARDWLDQLDTLG